MMKFIKYAAGIAILLGVLFNVQVASSQVYSQYLDGGTIVTSMPYQELNPFLKEVLPANEFALPPSFNTPNRDDGYVQITLPFPFEFNDEVYGSIWVSVNGFATFSEPLALPAIEPRGLFYDEPSSYTTNVLAPFWGDHFYRTSAEINQGYMPSEISYQVFDLDNDLVDDAIAIQWKDLNINNKAIESSVGNFQLWLFKSTNLTTSSGDIAFAYGTVGGNPYTDKQEVITRNASVGIKGSSTGFQSGRADFLNGLFPSNLIAARDSILLTNTWPPSGGTDRRITYFSNANITIDCCWGDGDADLSKGRGSRHFGLPQNRFVTYNDVRLIMRAAATSVPLDSVRRRSAFHADVNHNGRFYFASANGERTDIPWKDMNYAENLPSEINSIQRIFFQATEYDAAIILSYLAAKVPELPWLLDTIVNYGKIDVAQNANGIRFGDVITVSETLYQVPVYLNSSFTGPMSLNMTFDQEVSDIAVNSDDIEVDGSDNKVILAGFGEFNSENPVCVVTFTSANQNLNVSNIRYNDEIVDDMALNLTSVEVVTDGSASSVSPNPFVSATRITIPNVDGNVEVAIYDLLGNKVKTLANNATSGNIFVAEWNGTDMNGNTVENGVYIYKLSGSTANINGKIIFNK